MRQKIGNRDVSFPKTLPLGWARVICILMALTISVGITPSQANAADSLAKPVPMNAAPSNTLGQFSDSDIWYSLHHGYAGTSSAKRPEDRKLFSVDGLDWLDKRRADGGLIINAAGLLLGAVILTIGIFAFVRGRIRIDGGVSGRKLPRHSLAQRVVHWSLASLFGILALSGLILLFGRILIIPAFGKSTNAVLATAAMQAHNLFGPIFSFFLAIAIIVFLRGNMPSRVDVKWLLKGGGMFGQHAPAGRYNLGEKFWFWTLTGAGIALSVTGFILLFPDNIGPAVAYWLMGTADQRIIAPYLLGLHVVAAITVIALALGHIYLGTWGTEGTISSMVDGTVDENWAKTHHDEWFREMSRKQASEDRHVSN